MWCPDLYKSKPQIMKTAIGRPLFIIFIIALLSNKKLQAQTWSTTGNSGLTTSNFLGTTDNKALIFKIKNIERGRLLTNGTWRFGTAVKYVAIDSTGNINSTSLAGVGYRPLYADSAGNITTNAPATTGVAQVTNNEQVSIPDNSCTGAASTIILNNLPGSVQSSSITVKLNVYHTRLEDLAIYLIAPNGDILNLAKDSIKGDIAWLQNPHLINTTFSDAGISLKLGTSPYTGTFKPEGNSGSIGCGIVGNVSNFAAIGGGSINPNGVWTLKVFDTEAGTSGNVENWTISVNPGVGLNDVWKLDGNVGSKPSNFIGNIDDRPLYFKVNNIHTGALGKNASVAFGKLAFGNDSSYRSVAIGDSALYTAAGTNYNTAVGFKAGYKNLHGNNNTFLGGNADASVDNLTNVTVIGYNASVGLSNTMMFGNSAVKDWGFGNAVPAKGYALAVGTSSNNGNGAKLTEGGTWTNASDKNLKEDFQKEDAKMILRKINQLNIERWKYKGTDNEYHIGPIAQDFYKLFNLGVDDRSISTIDPSGIALLAIQALSNENDSLKAEITALKNLFLQHVETVDNCNPCVQKSISSDQQNIYRLSLEQNYPNPFSNSTLINYTLPQTFTNAKIIVKDKTGKTLRSVNISGSGKGNVSIEASAFSPGVYSYSLYVNEKLVATKQMIISK
jgi:hypothetical protein